MAGSIAVKGTEQSLPLNDIAQRGHHRPRGFVFDQLGVVNLTGGVIQNHQQIQPSVILKPLMMAAINVEQHAGNRPTWPAFAVGLSIATLVHQTRTLQQGFHPRVAQRYTVLSGRLLVKVTHLQIEVRLAVERQNPFGFPGRNSFPTRLAFTAVEKSLKTLMLIIPLPASHRSVA